jgi:hypothetical protein
VQFWDRTGLRSALGRTNLGALAGVDAIAAIAAQLPRDGSGRAPKGSSNLSHGEVLNKEAGESHALFGLDLFVVFQWSDLHLRILRGLQVLHFSSVRLKSEQIQLLSAVRWFGCVSIGLQGA